MSAGLKRLFGAGKKTNNVESASAKLKETESILTKKQQVLEKRQQLELDNAKKYLRTNRKVAASWMNKYMQTKKLLEQNDNTLMAVQAQGTALDNAQMNQNVLNAMQVANSALKNVHSNMNVDKVHDIMDDINEQQELANEIATAISSPIGTNQYDEDELLQELEALAAEDIESQLLDVGGVSDLPSVPVGEPVPSRSTTKPSRKADDEAEFANLAQWAS